MHRKNQIDLASRQRLLNFPPRNAIQPLFDLILIRIRVWFPFPFTYISLLFQLDWDDTEEQSYRRWLRQLQEDRAAQTEIDWSELDSEVAYRERLRRQTEANADVPIRWDDKQERILRDKYVQMR